MATILIILALSVITFGSNIESKIPLSEFTKEEITIIESSKNTPVKIGIIPNLYPMSICPPENKKFDGITVDMLKLITQKSGLQFEYVRIPTEKSTPVAFLKSKEVDLVAGNMKIKKFLEDKELILSEKLFDATVVFVARRGMDPDTLDDKVVTIAMMNNFQAGLEYINDNFKKYKIVSYKTTGETLDAVKSGKVDFAVVNRYVVGYYLQKPYYPDIGMVNSHTISLENCITARIENKILISIINKSLNRVTEKEYNHVLMNFTIASPYELSFTDLLYKYRIGFIIITLLIVVLLYTIMKLLSAKRMKDLIYYDKLTGLLSQFGFEDEVEKLLKNKNGKYYIIHYDVVGFDGYNAAYGRDNGDRLLKHIAKNVMLSNKSEGYTARIYADNFVTIVEAADISTVEQLIKQQGNLFISPIPDVTVMLIYGVFQIFENSLPIKTMIDMAISAKRNLKDNAESFYAIYDSELHKRNIEDANIVSYFSTALKNEEYYVVYQPKYELYTERVVGSEALIRWRRQDGTIVYPNSFIELFEKNGQIIQLDFYMLNKVCKMLRDMIDSGIEPIKVSVNFSRVNIYEQNFVSNLMSVVEKYNLSPSLLEIELTETAMVDDKKYILPIILELRNYGFTIALDDFGSGYSSLNSLKDLTIDVLKIDRKFFLFDEDFGKGQKIVRNLLKLIVELDIKCVAEGVETKAQLEFLRECGGCNAIQGYYFSKPIEQNAYVEIVKSLQNEPE